MVPSANAAGKPGAPAKPGQATALGPRGFADGGLVERLRGAVFGPKETTEQKYARQDAELRAKRPDLFKDMPAPAPPARTPGAPGNAIGNYVGNSALQRREKEAGLKDGGKVSGPGTGTSDSVPAMLSHGEFVMPADSVKKIGAATLMAMKDATHEQSGQPETKHGMPARADGTSEAEARRLAAVAQIPTDQPIPPGGFKPNSARPSDWTRDSELGRNVYNTAMALSPVAGGGAARVAAGFGKMAKAAAATPAAAAVAPFAPPVAGGGALMAASASPSASAPANVPATVPATLPGTAPSPGTVAPTPADPPTDAVTLNGQTGTSVEGASGVNKFKTGDGRTLYSNVAAPDNDKLMSSRPGVQMVPGAASPGAGAGTAQTGLGFSPELSAARAAAAARGDFNAVRDSYFAQGQSFNGQTRESVEADRIKALALSPRGTPGRAAALELQRIATTEAGATTRAAMTHSTQQQHLDLERTAQGFKSREAKRVEGLYEKYDAAKTAEERAAVAQQIRDLAGKTDTAGWKPVTLQGGMDAMGNKTESILGAVNERTGEMRRYDQAGAGLPPGMKKQVGTSKGKPVYEDASGKRFIGG